MNKVYGFIGLCFLIILSACSNSDVDINPSSIEGKWSLNSIDNKIKYKESSEINKTENYDSKNLVLDLKPEGVYAINAQFVFAELKESPTITTGQYTVNDNSLILKYYDSSLKTDVNINFEISTSSNSKLVLNLSKSGLFKSIDEVSQKANSITSTMLSLFQGTIIDYNVSYNLTKVN